MCFKVKNYTKVKMKLNKRIYFYFKAITIFVLIFNLSCESKFVEKTPYYDTEKKMAMETRIIKKNKEDEFLQLILRSIKNLHYITQTLYLQLSQKEVIVTSKENLIVEKITLNPYPSDQESSIGLLSNLIHIFTDKIPSYGNKNIPKELDKKLIRQAQLKLKNKTCPILDSILTVDDDNREIIIYFKLCNIVPQYIPSIKINILNQPKSLNSDLDHQSLGLSAFKFIFLNTLFFDIANLNNNTFEFSDKSFSCTFTLEENNKQAQFIDCQNTPVKVVFQNSVLNFNSFSYNSRGENILKANVDLFKETNSDKKISLNLILNSSGDLKVEFIQ